MLITNTSEEIQSKALNNFYTNCNMHSYKYSSTYWFFAYNFTNCIHSLPLATCVYPGFYAYVMARWAWHRLQRHYSCGRARRWDDVWTTKFLCPPMLWSCIWICLHMPAWQRAHQRHLLIDKFSFSFCWFCFVFVSVDNANEICVPTCAAVKPNCVKLF